jgi:hypothetical protein
MSQTASTLLLRNLHDVFGEIDPVRRRATIDEIFHEDAVFYEPNGAYRGRDEIDRIAHVIKATHPDFQYQPLSPPEEIGDGCRVLWVSGSPGKPPAYAGTDFIIVRDGKIAALYLSLTSSQANWLLLRSPNVLLIPGTSSAVHLKENNAAANLRLPPQVVERLNSIAVISR